MNPELVASFLGDLAAIRQALRDEALLVGSAGAAQASRQCAQLLEHSRAFVGQLEARTMELERQAAADGGSDPSCSLLSHGLPADHKMLLAGLSLVVPTTVPQPPIAQHGRPSP